MPDFLQTMIKEISKKAFKILKCSDYACIDLIIKEEEIYFLEINTVPGFTKTSLLPKAILLMDTTIEQFLNDTINYTIKNK